MISPSALVGNNDNLQLASQNHPIICWFPRKAWSGTILCMGTVSERRRYNVWYLMVPMSISNHAGPLLHIAFCCALSNVVRPEAHCNLHLLLSTQIQNNNEKLHWNECREELKICYLYDSTLNCVCAVCLSLYISHPRPWSDPGKNNYNDM